MGRFTARIARGIAAATVIAVPSTLMASAPPAHAATHWTIDKDHIVLGASSSNNYKAFDGTVESWYDGTHLRATLTGTFVGRGTLTATWIYHDESPSDPISDYTNGVQHDIRNWTSPSDKNVVRFTFKYKPNSGSTDSTTTYVGDAPKSTGSCPRLDQDRLDIAPANYASFHGSVWYGCLPNGNVAAHPDGTTTWAGENGTSDRAEFVYLYSDGTSDWHPSNVVDQFNTPSVSANGGSIWSDPDKDVECVAVRIRRYGGSQANTYTPATTVKFGEGEC
jgi:hypothetical protein